MKRYISIFIVLAWLAVSPGCSDVPENPVTAKAGADEVMIMDMDKPVSEKDLPKGWYHRKFWFRPPMQVSFVTKDNVKALRCATSAGGSIFGRFTDVDLGAYPRLSWRWFVEVPISSGLDERTKAGDDHPARLLVEFSDASATSHFMEIIWSNGALKRGEYKYIDDFPHYVARGGNENVGHWIEEEIDLLEIYHFVSKRDDSPHVKRVAIFCDSDDTGGKSVAYFGNIVLKKTK